MENYKGHFLYNEHSIGNNTPNRIGVYYLGVVSVGDLMPYYIGKSTNLETRIQEHFGAGEWGDVSHFGFHLCSTETEALEWEASEIKKFQPKYNKQGK